MTHPSSDPPPVVSWPVRGHSPEPETSPYGASPPPPQPYGAPSYGGQQHGTQPYGGPPSYGAQPYGMPPAAPQPAWQAAPMYAYTPQPPQNTMAIVSFALSLAGAVLGPVALVLGLIALNQIRQSGARGRGFAITGIVLGTLETFAMLFWVLIFFTAVSL